MTAPYPNDLLADICEQLAEWDLTMEQITALANDIPREVGAIMEAAAERYWENRDPLDDSNYRREMIAAGRGRLLK